MSAEAQDTYWRGLTLIPPSPFPIPPQCLCVYLEVYYISEAMTDIDRYRSILTLLL